MSADSGDPSDPRAVEARQLAKYRHWYKPATIGFAKDSNDPYFPQTVEVRLEEVRRRYRDGTALDLCCGNGCYAVALAAHVERIVGVDFSPEMVAAAAKLAAAERCGNTAFLVANARTLPLADASVSLVYSFSALYTIPAVEEVVAEVARVLGPAGTAILEFGALWSLNTLVSRATPETAEPCHVPVAQMRRMLCRCGLAIDRDRCFQILPLWGNRPWWLRPLLLPVFKRIVGIRVGGRMLDEWISSLPGLRRCAFRHMVICHKAGGKPAGL